MEFSDKQDNNRPTSSMARSMLIFLPIGTISSSTVIGQNLARLRATFVSSVPCQQAMLQQLIGKPNPATICFNKVT